MRLQHRTPQKCVPCSETMLPSAAEPGWGLEPFSQQHFCLKALRWGVAGGLDCRGVRTNPDGAGPRQSVFAKVLMEFLSRCLTGTGGGHDTQQGKPFLWITDSEGQSPGGLVVRSGWLRVTA